MVKAVDHVCFTVSDRDRAVDFYGVLLQSEPLSMGEDSSEVGARIIGYDAVALRFAYFALPGCETTLELFEYRQPPGRSGPLETFNVGNGHLGLVVDDLDAEQERLAVAGATFSQPRPVSIPTGPWKGSRALYMRDPDGITIELLQFAPGRVSRVPHVVAKGIV